MELARKLELHFYLNDKSHSMDAIVKNKCEAELLAAAYEVISELGISLSIDAEALKEGGIKDVWRILGGNSNQIAIVISILALIFSQMPSTNSDLDKLHKEDVKLSIEQKKLLIKKLKKELNENNFNKETIESTVEAINNNVKVATRKSNFYKSLNQYSKVSKIGLSTLDIDNNSTTDEILIERDEFKNFILISQDLQPEKIIEAEIEIVAPVLKEGRAKWKGIYNKESISFHMGDNDFKREVLAKRISFKNGSAIICVLLVHKKIDETGEVVITGYTVDTVLDNIDSGTSVETDQGKKFRFSKKQREDQHELFKDKDA